MTDGYRRTPRAIDTDLVVVTAMANDGVIGLETLEGLDRGGFNDSVEELIAMGFLEPVLVAGDEHLLELCLPEGLRSGVDPNSV